ncbi:DNA-binding protein [Rubellimicrobium arenae]|uniref:DNA-binding protein n=1 Tax=Rubellimicrobium arenae TaxID=2817372 RepID=UPI001B305606|nr:DNA-binding protein [Rubellimicrobium arenae]
MTTNNKASAALEKKVRAAVAELEKDGVRVTNATVRAKTGGSFRDLGPLVKALLAEKEARAKAEREVPEMPDDVAELATALWEGAYRLADEGAAAERRASAERIKALEAERDDRENEVALLEDERDATLTRAEAAEVRLAAQVRENLELKMKIASLEGRLQGRIEAAKESGKEADDATDGAKRGPDDPHQTNMFGLIGEPAAVERPAA